MKKNINLGSIDKFVPYGTNGVKNCLELCKMILRKYGVNEFGSPINAIKLIYEKGNKLVYYDDNPKDTYEQAIACIDRHLEKNRPIIVGVNHTIGRNINEGTTDHFVVVYGRELDGENYIYYYYEVGKSNVLAGYNDKENRFIYDPVNLQFYDDKSNRNDKSRFDVTQVRPND